MRRMAIPIALMFALVLAAAACKKKEPPQVPPPGTGAPAPGMPGAPAGPPPGTPGAPEKKVVVPDGVKAGWKAVKIEIEIKEKKSKKQYTVPLNADFSVPDTPIVLKVGGFLPHFSMTADQITSASDKLENPAVKVDVIEGGKPVFEGWLFSKFPDIHPFQHEKYGVRFLEPVKK